ncbi:MAG TPA: PilZ domain-containing protein [Phycisphaerales bacterium]|nr:PilZ domain-containing protein [Phycisphaerales bacterium]
MTRQLANPARGLASLFSRSNVNTRGPLRFTTDNLDCSEGRIMDLSVTGMRLTRSRSWRPGESREVLLTSRAGLPVRLRATCVWARRTGPFRHTVGVAFTDLHRRDEILLAGLVQRHARSVVQRRAA